MSLALVRFPNCHLWVGDPDYSSTYPGMSVVVRPSSVRPSVILSDFYSVSVPETSQSVETTLLVADMAADMEVHMVAGVVANMAADKKNCSLLTCCCTWWPARGPT